MKKFLLTIIAIFSYKVCLARDIKYTPEIGFPGFKGEMTIGPDSIGNFIHALHGYLIYIAGILAVIVISIGAFQWILAGGNKGRDKEGKITGGISAAKNKITNAILGLVLILSSVLILNIINPELTLTRDLNMIGRIDRSSDNVDCAKEIRSDESKCKHYIYCDWTTAGAGYYCANKCDYWSGDLGNQIICDSLVDCIYDTKENKCLNEEESNFLVKGCCEVKSKATCSIMEGHYNNQTDNPHSNCESDGGVWYKSEDETIYVCENNSCVLLEQK